MVNFAISNRMPAANVRDPDEACEDDGEFVAIKDVPIFAEHQTQAKDGRHLSFGYNELKLVCDRCNQRIAETGDYAAIVIGHTPDPELVRSGKATQPPIVGFAGPFRMGVLGTEPASRRYCILADFRIFKCDIDLVRRHPRRSPELWLEETYDRMFLDPIALLGSEAPRLDMGLLYSAWRHDGRSSMPVLVEKYSAVAPAAGNVFVPSTKYAAGDPGNVPARSDAGGSFSMLTQDDLGQIVQAIQQTDVWQWAQSQMSAATGPKPSADQPAGPDLSSVPPASPMDQPPSGPPPAGPGPNGGPPPMAPPQAAGGSAPPPADRTKAADNMAGMAGLVPKSAYAAGADDDDDDDDKNGNGSPVDDKEKVNYSRQPSLKQLIETVTAQHAQIATLQTQLNEERAHRINAERYGKLQRMVSEGVILDIDKEMKRLNYSKINDEGFESAVEFISDHATRMPTNLLIPTFDDVPSQSSSAGREKYSKEQADRALKICEQKAIRGENVSYEATLAEVAAGRL